MTRTVALGSAIAALAAPSAAMGYEPPGILDCPIDQPRAKNGQKPKKALVVKVMRCGFEKHETSTHYAEKMTVSKYRLGGKRRWNPHTDLGDGGRKTWRWSIKLTWTTREYRMDNVVAQTNISIFECFVNLVREWECGLSRRISDGEIQYLPPETG